MAKNKIIKDYILKENTIINDELALKGSWVVELEEKCSDCTRIKQDINQQRNMTLLFPYLRKSTRQITEQELISLSLDNAEYLTKLYNEIFSENQPICNCPSIHSEMMEKLQILYNYQQL